MKFLHAADIHLESSIVPLNGQSSSHFSISDSIKQAFVRLVDLAIEEKVDFLLFSGDIFDENWKDYSIGIFFIEQIKRLSCPIFAIRGNHDSENRLLKKLPYPKHFHWFSSKEPETVKLDSLSVALHGMSYKTYKQSNNMVIAYPELIPDYFNICLLHTSAGQVGYDPYAPCSIEDLKDKGYDYWALGHIHQREVLSKKPLIVYPGNIQGRHIQEPGIKGCYIIETSDFLIKSLTFYPLTKSAFLKMVVKLDGIQNDDDLRDLIVEQMRGLIHEEIETYILRVIYVGFTMMEIDLDYYKNSIYCWLVEEFDQNIIIEKVLNQTKKRLDFQRNGKKNLALKVLQETIKKISEDSQLYIKLKEEYLELEKSLPKGNCELKKICSSPKVIFDLLPKVEALINNKLYESDEIS